MASSKQTSAGEWRKLWLEFLIASTFLTRVPVGFPIVTEVPSLAQAMRWFPLVGALIGAVGGGALHTATLLGLGPLTAGFCAIAATILITGALHEDGLADCADGFGGGRDRAAKLAILRDSRIGSYGALALVISVGLRASLLADGAAIEALIAAHALSRASAPVLLRWLPLARGDGLAARAGGPSMIGTLTAVTLGAIIAIVVLGPTRGLLALAIAGLGGWLVGGFARRQIGGVTGDVLGAAEQVIEILALAVAIARPIAW